MFGNTDDHFRNHGFLLTPKGWTLSPAYDINPGVKLYQCLLIDQYTDQSDVNTLLAACNHYMLEHQEAAEIIDEVRDTIRTGVKQPQNSRYPIRYLPPIVIDGISNSALTSPKLSQFATTSKDIIWLSFLLL